MPVIIFSMIPLLVAFAILGFYDIIGLGRIGLNIILFLVFVFVFIFIYQIIFLANYFNITQYWEITTIISIIILLLIPRLGVGDKIFLAAAFLVYPFWFIWVAIILAMLLIRPFFKIILHFVKDREIALPFYPFLFLAALITYLIGNHYQVFSYITAFGI